MGIFLTLLMLTADGNAVTEQAQERVCRMKVQSSLEGTAPSILNLYYLDNE